MVALGREVDAVLQAKDVRLTMGGEPTFVASSDRDAAEWNIDALGPTKRLYAQELVQRLRDEYGRGGFLHYGQGKWYPGEQLPRWALGCYWRKPMANPVWQNPRWLADERVPHAHTSADAGGSLHGRTDAAAGPEHRLPATRLRGRLVPPLARASLAGERRPLRQPLGMTRWSAIRLRRVFDQGLSTVVGYALPLQSRTEDDSGWRTGPWFLRDERMYLHPGDSPMGFRLPLDSMPWVKPSDATPSTSSTIRLHRARPAAQRGHHRAQQALGSMQAAQTY